MRRHSSATSSWSATWLRRPATRMPPRGTCPGISPPAPSSRAEAQAGGLLRSVQRFDGCDRHQILHGMGELPIERDQRVAVELGQGDVLGVKGVRPPEQAGGLPCDVLKDAVSEQPDPEPAHVVELSLGIPPGHLTAAYCLIEKRQQL